MRLFLSLILLALPPFTPAPHATQPPTGSIIYVQETLDGQWDSELRRAIRYVDGFTHRSTMVLGPCRPAHRCIRISYGDARGIAVGTTNVGASTIVVRRTWVGYRLRPHIRERLAIHELGHIFGLKHNPSTKSVMYYEIYLGSYFRTSGATFTTPEKNWLANQ